MSFRVRRLRSPLTIAGDEKIDALEQQIEEKSILTIAKRQPMAQDLRQIIVAIRISADLERIGDLAINTAKRTHAISEQMPRKLVSGLTRMGNLAQEQLNKIDAYARNDADKAILVWRSDEDIDALYNSIFRELLTYMMEDPRMIGPCTHLLFGTKNMERIGDHTTNIAENIYFLVHGKAIIEERPKKDLRPPSTSWPATWYFTEVNDACTENDHCEFTGAMLPAMPIACATVAAEWPLTLPIAAVAPNTVLE